MAKKLLSPKAQTAASKKMAGLKKLASDSKNAFEKLKKRK